MCRRWGALNSDAGFLAALKGAGKLGDSALKGPWHRGSCRRDAACGSFAFGLVGGAGADVLAAATEAES